MQHADPILAITLECLRLHLHRKWGDREPIDVFNRLMAKHIKPAGWTPCTHMDIRPEQIRSRREQWPLSRMAKLTRHSGLANPRTRFDGPMIVAEYEGVERLLDGNHRINTWLARGDLSLRDVHIHTIEGTSGFVELHGIA